MTAIKNIAVREGYIHKSFETRLNVLRTNGTLYPMSKFDNNKRKQLGLPDVSSENSEVKELFKLTGLGEKTKSEG